MTAIQTRQSSQLNPRNPDTLARANVLRVVERNTIPNKIDHSTSRSGGAAPDSTAIASKDELPVLTSNGLPSILLDGTRSRSSVIVQSDFETSEMGRVQRPSTYRPRRKRLIIKTRNLVCFLSLTKYKVRWPSKLSEQKIKAADDISESSVLRPGVSVVWVTQHERGRSGVDMIQLDTRML